MSSVSSSRRSRAPEGEPRGLLSALLLLWLAALPAVAGAQESEESARRFMAPDDYGKFESLGQFSLSPDGSWLAAAISRVEEDGEVRLQRTDGDSVVVLEKGTRAEFSGDGRWAAVLVPPGRDERNRSNGDRTPPRNAVVLADLATGELERREEVSAWEFSPDGRFIALRRYGPGNDGNARGADVVVRELATGTDVNFGNVGEMAWHDDEPFLAMTVDAAGMAGNGVRLYTAETGAIRTLHSEEARFSDLTWRDEAFDLAVLREDPDTIRGDTVRTVLAWRGTNGDAPAAFRLSGALEGPDGRDMRITEFQGIRWSEDGSRIFVAAAVRARPQEEADEGEGDEGEGDEEDSADEEAGEEDEGVPGLEIWHSRDVDPVPQQRVRSRQLERMASVMGWELDGGGTVFLGEGHEDVSVQLIGGERAAFLTDGRPYRPDRMFGPAYRDIYVVDVATGERELVAERVEHSRGASPEGRYLLYFHDDDYHAYDREAGMARNLTAELDGVFANQEVDRPVDQRPPYGHAGWLEGDEAVLVYDRYDIWRVAADGSGGERLTRGAEEEVRHRIVRMDFDEPALDPSEPLYIALYGEWTKESGYARLHPDGRVERLVYEGRSIGRLSRSDDGGTYAFLTQRYDQSPVLHLTGSDFGSSRAVLRTNPFVADEFLVGRSELVDYENEWGEPLQGALFYPAGYEPGRQYPMIIYHYERRSQALHSWSNPSERSAYNTRVFTQNGYFVLQPDIVYRTRDPGVSFMAAVLPALDAALATGMIDPERVGITGHSWGGYQTTFAVTQTDRFAAGVAGAPLTNLVSMYLSFYWNTGGTDARIFEVSQGRMEVPWWEDFEAYARNSPVHHIQNMNTPLLMAFGTEDGAVEFNQGVEFYNAARRAAKDFVLLVYEGENHSLQERANQLDYHRRTLEWFNHYLKGHEAPAWITEGVPYLDQQKKLQDGPAAGRRPGAPEVHRTTASGG